MNLIYLLASPHLTALRMVLGTAALVRDEEQTFQDLAFSFRLVGMTFKLRLLDAGTSISTYRIICLVQEGAL